MKNLYNLSIRRKFAVVIVPLIAIIILFDYFQIKHNYENYHDSSRLNKAILIGIEINHVVHEIQKERSISVGFISTQGLEFSKELQFQRGVTDSTIAQFTQEIETKQLKELMDYHRKDVDFLKTYFDRLTSIRRQIDELSIKSDQAIRYYSDINTTALLTVNQLINETLNKEVAQEVHAIIYFLKAKERASIERAVGTQAFSLNHLGYDLYNQFTTLVAAQDAYIDDFLTITNNNSREYYQRLMQGPEIEEVNRLRNVLFLNEKISENPNLWYNMMTNKINTLKKVEDFMSENILAYTEQVSADAFRDFWTFLVLDILIGLLSFWLMTVIVSNLLENVSKLEDFTQVVSMGTYTRKVYIETRDEIGQYAKTFNVMVEEIRKSHAELKKERDRARFLYQNIYKVSQMVFENIQQGIFLLDREFKISKLYSAAMKDIFGNQKIAGENFVSFMRPLILPREMEALEMFMKHLFNEDMDEDVVNQLNPVEQVKIFTEIEGVVLTKYIRIAFTRIERKGMIQSIMVTISDETESVLLQQHLDEAEAKKKQETEQVLTILKIDPAVMRGFIYNTKKLLRNISERYEQSGNKNLLDLLEFTFQTIHNLKGNAAVIGLELMSTKLHNIEESIVKLKSKENISGKDFLSLLYEIDEADSILYEMGETLRKVANIYKKFPSEGQIVSNIMVIDTLEKGVELISKELNKSVDLTFKNDHNIVIPENFINTFKDVMIQLIRNSIVHSIEEPKIREGLGKTTRGNITIKVDQSENDEMVINYKDDGKGLDTKKIKETAIERNLITEFDAKKMSSQQIIDLIFQKGFSTSDKVDNHSGRGQGMSLIKTIIEGKNGSFVVSSESGKFFEMIIKLPLNPNDLTEKAAS